jgi:hypothetical protein
MPDGGRAIGAERRGGGFSASARHCAQAVERIDRDDSPHVRRDRTDEQHGEANENPRALIMTRPPALMPLRGEMPSAAAATDREAV